MKIMLFLLVVGVFFVKNSDATDLELVSIDNYRKIPVKSLKREEAYIINPTEYC